MPPFDLRATDTVEELLDVPADRRDDAWRRHLYAALPDASLASGDPQVFTGPDGFSYFALHLPPAGQTFDAFSVNHVLEACTVQGLGCVVHDHASGPAWVLRYGELWSLRALGRIDARPPGEPGEPQVLVEPAEAVVGAPGDTLLPPWARAVLRAALAAIGVADPTVVAIHRPGRVPEWSLGLGGTDELSDELRTRLTWYLPPHIGLLHGAPDGWADAAAPL